MPHLFSLPFHPTICRLLGSLKTFVTVLINPPVISFGEIVTTKAFTWLVRRKLLVPKIKASWESEQLGKLIFVFLVNLFGIFSNLLQNFGWISYLTGRYVVRHKIFHASTHAKDTSTWSSIMHAKNALKDGFSWHAGSGSSSFWFCPWSSLGFIGSLPPYIDIHDLHLTIIDVFSTNGPHTQGLYSHLPPLVTDFINNIHIKLNPSVEDAFISTPNKNGIYTTKSG